MGPETQAKISRTVLALVSSHLTRLAKVAPVSTGKRPAHGRKLCPHMARGGPHSSQQRVTPRPVGTWLHGKNDIYNPNHDGTNDGDSKADTAKGWCRWPYEGMGRVRSVEQAQAWRARLRLFYPTLHHARHDTSAFRPIPTKQSRNRKKVAGTYLVDPASSHMLVSKIKPCMSKYILLHSETANGSLNQLWFLRSYNPTWITVVILELIHEARL